MDGQSMTWLNKTTLAVVMLVLSLSAGCEKAGTEKHLQKPASGEPPVVITGKQVLRELQFSIKRNIEAVCPDVRLVKFSTEKMNLTGRYKTRNYPRWEFDVTKDGRVTKHYCGDDLEGPGEQGFLLHVELFKGKACRYFPKVDIVKRAWQVFQKAYAIKRCKGEQHLIVELQYGAKLDKQIIERIKGAIAKNANREK